MAMKAQQFMMQEAVASCPAKTLIGAGMGK